MKVHNYQSSKVIVWIVSQIRNFCEKSIEKFRDWWSKNHFRILHNNCMIIFCVVRNSALSWYTEKVWYDVSTRARCVVSFSKSKTHFLSVLASSEDQMRSFYVSRQWRSLSDHYDIETSTRKNLWYDRSVISWISFRNTLSVSRIISIRCLEITSTFIFANKVVYLS